MSEENLVKSFLELTIKEQVQKFEDWLNLRGEYAKISYRIRDFLIYCKNRNIVIDQVSYDDFSKYLLYTKERKVAPWTFNNIFKSLKKFYTFFSEIHNIENRFSVDLKKFKYLKPGRKKKDYITFEELNILVRDSITYLKSWNPVKMKAILYFLFFTGVRLGEFLNLKRENFDLKKERALIKLPNKTLTERWVCFPPFVTDLLRTYFNSEPEEKNAFNVMEPQLDFWINQLNKFLPKGRHISIKSFRDSFAMMLGSKGMDIRMIQKLLGHKSLSSTLVYYDPDFRMAEQLYKEKIRMSPEDL